MKNATKIIVRVLSFIIAVVMMVTLFTGCPLTEKFIYKRILSDISKEFSGKNVNIEYVLLDMNKDGSNEMIVKLINGKSTEYRLYDSSKDDQFIGTIINDIHPEHHIAASCSKDYSFIIQFARQGHEIITGINYNGSKIISKELINRTISTNEDYYNFEPLSFYSYKATSKLSSAVALNSVNGFKLNAIINNNIWKYAYADILSSVAKEDTNATYSLFDANYYAMNGSNKQHPALDGIPSLIVSKTDGEYFVYDFAYNGTDPIYTVSKLGQKTILFGMKDKQNISSLSFYHYMKKDNVAEEQVRCYIYDIVDGGYCRQICCINDPAYTGGLYNVITPLASYSLSNLSPIGNWNGNQVNNNYELIFG